MVINSNSIELQNPWWGNPQAIDKDQHLLEITGKPYEFNPPILNAITTDPGDIHIIRGPRQVGKTTLLKLLIKRLLKSAIEPHSIIYISCESIESFDSLHSLLIDLLKDKMKQKTYLLLDEISFIHEWQRALLGIANMGLIRNATVIITGSNARDLKESGERLPGRRGRGKDHKLYPLSITELMTLPCFRNRSLNELFDIYMSIGGFPLAVRDFVTIGKVTDATYETYRNWIVGDAQRYELRQETLKQILFRISETIASRITWPKLIENSPVRSHETALEYVEHLQDAFLCLVHYCYDPDTRGPAMQKSRKIYFIDPLLYAIAGTWRDGIPNVSEWMSRCLDDSEIRGKLFENTVVNHLHRIHESTYYWYSTKTKREVDLVIQSGGEIEAYEIKLKRGPHFRAMGREIQVLNPEEFLRIIAT